MDVVRHEAIGPYLRIVVAAKTGEEPDVKPIIIGAEEHIIPADAALRYMMRDSGDNHSCHACHHSTLATHLSTNKK